MSTPTKPQGVVGINGQTLQRWMAEKKVVLIDVREPAEHQAERIVGAQLMPLSNFDPQTAPRDPSVTVVLHCKGGVRSRKAGEKLVAAGWEGVHHLEGGIEAWKCEGLPVEKTDKAGKVMDLMRQTQLAIGLFALTGTILAATVSSWFLLLTGMIGAGLCMAGLTGMCPLMSVIAKMPWNKTSACSTGCGCGK